MVVAKATSSHRRKKVVTCGVFVFVSNKEIQILVNVALSHDIDSVPRQKERRLYVGFLTQLHDQI